MRECPSEDVLILYASTQPDTDPDDGELLDGWTADGVAGHLTLCPSCRTTVEVSSALTVALRGDALDEPPAEFWDEMAEQVMRRLDEAPASAATPSAPRSARRVARDEATVIPLRRPGQVAVEPPSAPERQRTVWLWAAAAALALALSLGAVLSQRDPGQGTAPADGGPTPVAVSPGLPDAADAAAAAAALGLSLDPIDPGALAETDVAELAGAVEQAGVSSLRRSLQGADVDDVELALGYDDAISELFELDTEAMEDILAALESKT